MVRLWPEVIAELSNASNVDRRAAPRRGRVQGVLPARAVPQETFANLYLDALAKPAGMPSLDWTMGPLCFRASLASLWTDFEGELWDAQIVPMVRAARWHGAVVASREVAFSGAATMRAGGGRAQVGRQAAQPAQLSVVRDRWRAQGARRGRRRQEEA